MKHLSRLFKPRRCLPAPIQLGDALRPFRKKIVARWLRRMVGPAVVALAVALARIHGAAVITRNNDMAQAVAGRGGDP
jgi:hypothetical protein